MSNTLPSTPENQYNLSCHPVRKNHSFFWDTDLSFERMCQISEWIGTLTKDQKIMLDELLDDVKQTFIDSQMG